MNSGYFDPKHTEICVTDKSLKFGECLQSGPQASCGTFFTSSRVRFSSRVRYSSWVRYSSRVYCLYPVGCEWIRPKTTKIFCGKHIYGSGDIKYECFQNMVIFWGSLTTMKLITHKLKSLLKFKCATRLTFFGILNFFVPCFKIFYTTVK